NLLSFPARRSSDLVTCTLSGNSLGSRFAMLVTACPGCGEGSGSDRRSAHGSGTGAGVGQGQGQVWRLASQASSGHTPAVGVSRFDVSSVEARAGPSWRPVFFLVVEGGRGAKCRNFRI